MLKKLAAVAVTALVLTSCSASPQELKETYFEKMQEYGVDKSEAIDAVEVVCRSAQEGESSAAKLAEGMNRKGGRWAEMFNVIVEYGVPAYCQKFVDDFRTGASA